MGNGELRGVNLGICRVAVPACGGPFHLSPIKTTLGKPLSSSSFSRNLPPRPRSTREKRFVCFVSLENGRIDPLKDFTSRRLDLRRVLFEMDLIKKKKREGNMLINKANVHSQSEIPPGSRMKIILDEKDSCRSQTDLCINEPHWRGRAFHLRGRNRRHCARSRNRLTMIYDTREFRLRVPPRPPFRIPRVQCNSSYADLSTGINMYNDSSCRE